MIIYNATGQARDVIFFKNHDAVKKAPWGTASVPANGSYTYMPPSVDDLDPLQVVIVTEKDKLLDDLGTWDFGYLVVDLRAHGDHAWVWLGGSPGAWDYRTGGGTKHYVRKLVFRPKAGEDADWTNGFYKGGDTSEEYDYHGTLTAAQSDATPSDVFPGTPAPAPVAPVGTFRLRTVHDTFVMAQSDGSINQSPDPNLELTFGLFTLVAAGDQRRLRTVHDTYVMAQSDGSINQSPDPNLELLFGLFTLVPAGGPFRLGTVHDTYVMAQSDGSINQSPDPNLELTFGLFTLVAA